MSTTSIYRLGRDPECIGECRNSWRGHMYVWNDVAKRHCGLPRFPLGFGGNDNSEMSRVWNAFTDPEMPEHERIVLATTMDYATVRGRDMDAVIAAFERYGKEHPESSISEQAEILKAADIRPNDLVGWQGTSVSEFWGTEWDSEKDEQTWYDPSTNKHFDAFAAATTTHTQEQR